MASGSQRERRPSCVRSCCRGAADGRAACQTDTRGRRHQWGQYSGGGWARPDSFRGFREGFQWRPQAWERGIEISTDPSLQLKHLNLEAYNIISTFHEHFSWIDTLFRKWKTETSWILLRVDLNELDLKINATHGSYVLGTLDLFGAYIRTAHIFRLTC